MNIFQRVPTNVYDMKCVAFNTFTFGDMGSMLPWTTWFSKKYSSDVIRVTYKSQNFSDSCFISFGTNDMECSKQNLRR